LRPFIVMLNDNFLLHGAMQQEIVIEHNYEGPQTLRGLSAGLIIVPATLFTASEDIERFVVAAPCPVLIVPASV